MEKQGVIAPEITPATTTARDQECPAVPQEPRERAVERLDSDFTQRARDAAKQK